MKPATPRPRRSPRRPQDRHTRTLPSIPPPRSPFPVLIAYSDVNSARQAMTRISRILQTSHPNCHLQPMLWRFDQLLKKTWYHMALHDARRSRVLAFAVANETALANLSEAWLGALLERAKGQLLHVLLTVGDTDPWTIILEQPKVKLRAGTGQQPKRALDRAVRVPRRARSPNQTTAVAA